MFGSSIRLVYSWLLVLCLCSDAVRLFRERGTRDNTYFYHLGDGGYAYHHNVDTRSSIYFKCVMYESGCRGRAILRVGGRFRHSQAHNHPPDPDFVGLRHFRENVLQQCMEGRYVSFQDILNEARRNRAYTRRVRSKMTMRRLRNSMHLARRKSFPPIPHTLSDLSRLLIQQQHRRISSTIDGEDNLYAGSVTALDGSHHVAFFSQRMLQFMGRVKTIQADGTFRCRPAIPYSSQCFVLVTTWNDAVIPLGWVLMENRKYVAYKAVFQLLKQICPNLNPEVIISDWEYPQQRAWQEAFPHAAIQGCMWHLCRAFVKKLNRLRLFRFRNHLPAMMTIIRKTCAIALLPSRYFRVALNLIRQEARETDVLIAYLLMPFFNYVENKWIDNVNRRRWMNFFNVLHRTNNACESHNRMLRSAVGAHRPNVYSFIEALARLEHNASLDIDLLNAGGRPRRTRRWRSVYQDIRLEALCRDLELDIFHNRDETLTNFLSQAITLFHQAFDEHVARVVGGQQ